MNIQVLFKTSTIIFATFLISGCFGEPIDKRVLVKSEKQVYEIIKVDEPPYFYIDIKNIKTGKTFKNLYVAKECKDWKKMNVGTKWTFMENTYKDYIRNTGFTIAEGYKDRICQK